VNERPHNGWGGDTAPPPRGAPDAGFGDQGTFALLREILTTAIDLAKGELRLLKSELKASVRSAVTGAVSLGIALVAGGAAINFLGLAAVGGLIAAGLPLWGAALIVGGVLLLTLVVALLVGIKAFKSVDPIPHQTLRNLQRDFDAMRNSMKNGKGDPDARQ
jgi:Putative Actinobacterial Holin-X, holin superfamily III